MNDLNEALEKVDLEHVLGSEGIDYKVTWGRSGQQLNARTCPFCGNNKYKVYINADTGLGNCFAGSCTQGTFNKWQLLGAIYDLGSADLKIKITHIALEQGWRPTRKVATRYDPGPLALPANVKVKDLHASPRYLHSRGVDPDMADYFDLRWCERGVFEVKNPLGEIITQDYSQRVLIPIYNLDGEMISFQGRDATGESPKRYLFPPMYASTGAHFYNINNWLPGMDTVVICEGVFDVIATQQAIKRAGWVNKLALGSFGMQLSIAKRGEEDQLSRLLALKDLGLKRIVILWDNEPTAIQNAIDTGLVLARYGFEVDIAKLDKSKDPGEAPPLEIIAALNNTHPLRSRLDALRLAKALTH